MFAEITINAVNYRVIGVPRQLNTAERLAHLVRPVLCWSAHQPDSGSHSKPMERNLHRGSGPGPLGGVIMGWTYFLGFSALLALVVWWSISEP